MSYHFGKQLRAVQKGDNRFLILGKVQHLWVMRVGIPSEVNVCDLLNKWQLFKCVCLCVLYRNINRWMDWDEIWHSHLNHPGKAG